MRDRFEWDDEPVGDTDEGKRRRWRRPVNVYLCFLLGAVGVLVLIGAVTAGSLTGTLGGACLVGASVAVVRADGPRARAGAPPPPAPPPAVEFGWYAAAVVLVVAAVLLVGTGAEA